MPYGEVDNHVNSDSCCESRQTFGPSPLRVANAPPEGAIPKHGVVGAGTPEANGKPWEAVVLMGLGADEPPCEKAGDSDCVGKLPNMPEPNPRAGGELTDWPPNVLPFVPNKAPGVG